MQVLSDGCQYMNRAVMLSGSAFNYWAHYKENNNYELLKEAFKTELGSKTSPQDILNYLQTAPADLIVQKSPAMNVFTSNLMFYWSPVIEGSSYHTSLFEISSIHIHFVLQIRRKLTSQFSPKDRMKFMHRINSAPIARVWM